MFQYTPLAANSQQSAGYEVSFLPDDCDQLLDLSQDENREDHHSKTGALLQGAALVLAIGTCISKYLPGWGPVCFEASQFERPIKVGATVCIQLTLLEETRREKRVGVSVSDDKGIILETGYTLCPTKLLARIAARA